MKKILTLLILVLSSTVAKADDDKVSAYLFPQFEKGYVVLKGSSGARVAALLNYNMIDERMMYLDSDSSLFELDASTVIMVSIGARSFIPARNNAFYEMIKTGNNEYYISYKSVLISQGKASGYGSYSQTSSIGNMASVHNTGTWSFISCDEKYAGVDKSTVVIKTEKKYEKVLSLKSLVKIFKNRQTALETFAKENKTDFNKLEHVISIVEFAFSHS